MVSISLSSGFSFQENEITEDTLALYKSFNLVIERLLISGKDLPASMKSPNGQFQSRYRAASHFRQCWRSTRAIHIGSFNLVIERLLISGIAIRTAACIFSGVSISLSSGFSFQVWQVVRARGPLNLQVSISLSSGFSFQVKELFGDALSEEGFNLVIERLLISGFLGQDTCPVRGAVSISLSSGFSFQGGATLWGLNHPIVSISLSSGFSFQVR